MTNYFNDSPIEAPEDDKYGISPFAQSLAKSICAIKAPIGTTIALNGPWGSGKSSAVNLIRHELENTKDNAPVISEFKCWWYRGEEALALAFLQNLNSLLSNTLKDKVKGLVPKIGRVLLQAGPVLGAAMALTPASPIASLTGPFIGFAGRFFPKGKTLEKTFQKLARVLKEEDRRFLIIIDDIDRLSPEEALAVFRIVKSVGQLPNVMYLLVFDRMLADKAVNELYPSEGPHFLEKIIQASFELPMPLQTDLNQAIWSTIETICGTPGEKQIQAILNLFYDVVAPYITTPRHVARFQNAISVTWPAIANEIRIADFIALETIRLYQPTLFQSIRSNKSNLCGTGGQDDRSNFSDESRFTPFLNGVDEEHHETAKLALQRLFPRLETMRYGNDSRSIWDAERRVCIESHFDTYFRLSLSNETLPIGRIEEFLSRADDREFVQATFREAANSSRIVGTSMVPVLLDELNTHALNMEKAKVEIFLSALFEIHDEIDLGIDDDSGMMAMGGTSTRIHWLIRRLTNRRFTIDERTDLYMAAIKQASIGWLVNFTSSVIADHRVEEGEQYREEDCLTRSDAIDELLNLALKAIRSSANDGSLLLHNDLIYILYRWRDFLSKDPTEVREWTDPLLKNSDAILVFAKKMTGESWSQGMGIDGLGDRVSRRTIRAQIDEHTDILDVVAFKIALKGLQKSGTLDGDSQKVVDEFLAAWKSQQDGQE